MKVHAYLYLSQHGGLRITKTKVNPHPTELAIALALDVPDTFFQRRIPVVNLTIPDHFANPGPEITARVIAPDVAAAMRIDVGTIEDGLLALAKAAAPVERNCDDTTTP